VWDLGNVANVIAHDMAHQWFGNSLTPKSWSDVWLNEGFATYAVALWREKQDGEAGYRAYMRSLDATTFDGPIYIQDNTSLHALLTPTTFNKGAWVLHMLRRVMGDKAFFTALRNYVATNRDGLVDTQAWIAACEQAYGKPLNWFFKEWVHGTGRPALRLTWKQTRDDRLALAVDQTQAGQVFTMPVDVAVKTASGESVTLVWLRHRHENVDLPVKGKVVGVVVDPGGWLLKAHPGHGT
jgi:aminopeptidase N